MLVDRKVTVQAYELKLVSFDRDTETPPMVESFSSAVCTTPGDASYGIVSDQ
jgi:hypothetical protein